MAPNEQWDDFALTREFDAIGRRMDMYDHALEGLSRFPVDVATAALNIEHLTLEVQSVRREVGEVNDKFDRVQVAARQDSTRKQKGRTLILVAIIAGCFTVLAALITLVGSLVGAQ